MEKKIKTLYILSIVAILAFLGMQVYWLYGRYEYSLTEYENRTGLLVTEALKEYGKARARGSATEGNTVNIQSRFQMSHGVDSIGKSFRKVTVRTNVVNGRKVLGIAENRKLTPEEMKRLEEIVMTDSLEMVDAKIGTIDASSAPSDGIAWNAMKNFEMEIQSPFTAEGIDSILKKHNLDAEVSLIIQDSVMWEPISLRHLSSFSPYLKMTVPYSELEKKAVEIVCRIPLAEVLCEMGWTMAMAIVLSIFLITCLVWQIKTIVKLTRLDKMRDSFITTMIHELKRPISTLKMCVSGFDNKTLMADTQLRHKLAGETRIALDNLSAYFSKLRDIMFNNIEQIPLNITSFNLADLVDGVEKSIAIPNSKHVKFKIDIADDLMILADRDHLVNVITNLIENAIKYSGYDVCITIHAERTTDGITINIADNGNGITTADRPKIFRRFYRGNASATDVPGMGLGLAYVKLLVDAHGGHISVESTVGTGSTFTIILPQ